MSKQFIITQEELDRLEAIRLELYHLFVEDDSITDVMKVGQISEPLWKIINKKREEIHD